VICVLIQPGMLPPNSAIPIVVTTCAFFPLIWQPVLNPLITLVTISAYRRALISFFCTT
jgi:hypothetical protein